VTLDPRHDAYLVLAAAPNRHLHSQLDPYFSFAQLHRYYWVAADYRMKVERTWVATRRH
jgi:hypothetical protein